MRFAKLKCITAIALCTLLSSAAWASTTWYVNGVSGSNSNNCLSALTACKTIRHSISLASSGDSIMVAAATYTERLAIGISLRVIGSGASTTIVDGGGANTVVAISSTNAHVTLSKMTISTGFASYGGGINNSGTLTINNSTVAGNTAGAWGGGIYNRGMLTISNSTISGNRATVRCTTTVCHTNGGGIFNDGGSLAINNSTVGGNMASISCRGFCIGDGGGIFNYNGTVTISNSTVSGNSAYGALGSIGAASRMAGRRRSRTALWQTALRGETAAAL